MKKCRSGGEETKEFFKKIRCLVQQYEPPSAATLAVRIVSSDHI